MSAPFARRASLRAAMCREFEAQAVAPLPVASTLIPALGLTFAEAAAKASTLTDVFNAVSSNNPDHVERRSAIDAEAHRIEAALLSTQPQTPADAVAVLDLLLDPEAGLPAGSMSGREVGALALIRTFLTTLAPGESNEHVTDPMVETHDGLTKSDPALQMVTILATARARTEGASLAHPDADLLAAFEASCASRRRLYSLPVADDAALEEAEAAEEIVSDAAPKTIAGLIAFLKLAFLVISQTDDAYAAILDGKPMPDDRHADMGTRMIWRLIGRLEAEGAPA